MTCVATVTSKYFDADTLVLKMDALLACFNAASVPTASVFRNLYFAFDLHVPLKLEEVSPHISGQGESLKCVVEDHEGNCFTLILVMKKKIRLHFVKSW